MKVVGIIAEYNPFHNGHQYQIEQIREKTNADYVIVAFDTTLDYAKMCKVCDYIRYGKPYIATGGQLARYPKFHPEDYVLLKLTPSKWEDKWYQWNQEVPQNASPELKAQAKEFSALKIGYRGDLRFSKLEVIELAQIMETQESIQEMGMQTQAM